MKYLQQPMDFPLLSCYLLAQHPSSFAAFPAPISLASFTACTLYSFSYFLCSCAILYTVLTLVILFLFCELEVSTFLYLIRSYQYDSPFSSAFFATLLVSRESRNTTNRSYRNSSAKFRTILMTVTRYSFHPSTSAR